MRERGQKNHSISAFPCLWCVCGLLGHIITLACHHSDASVTYSISHKCEKLLFRTTRRVYLDVYNQRTTLPSHRCIRLFPVCTKHCVSKRGRHPAANAQGSQSRARLATCVISEKEEMEKFFCLHYRVLTTLDSPRLRLDPPTRPVRSPPTRKAPLVGFAAIDNRPWFVNCG